MHSCHTTVIPLLCLRRTISSHNLVQSMFEPWWPSTSPSQSRFVPEYLLLFNGFQASGFNTRFHGSFSLVFANVFLLYGYGSEGGRYTVKGQQHQIARRSTNTSCACAHDVPFYLHVLISLSNRTCVCVAVFVGGHYSACTCEEDTCGCLSFFLLDDIVRSKT